jgi:hypothetical protein
LSGRSTAAPFVSKLPALDRILQSDVSSEARQSNFESGVDAGSSYDEDCPNPGKVSQNRAMPSKKQFLAYWSNPITGKSLD